jgi:subtilisin family serine protease
MKVLTTVILAAVFSLLAANIQAGEIKPRLQQQLSQRALSENVDVIIRFRNRADVKSFKDKDKKQRRKKIIRALKKRADLDQKLVKSLLKGIKAKKQRQLWLINGLAVSVPAEMVEVIASLPGVDSVSYDRKITLQGASAPVGAPAEWNIDAVRAPELWDILLDGSGIVVATLDSGADLNHPDLGPRWRGGSNSWFDPNGQHASPHDSLGHGTQVLGLMVGGNASGNYIGVAPGAQWIAVKIFDDADQAQLSAIHAGFQWLLDPDGNPLTDDAPDIVNNSWDLAGSVNICDGEFSVDIGALKAAEIAVVFAAGNTGPNPDTSISPANDPQSHSVGAVDINDNIVSFSGRGPSVCDGGIYPHLVAPGVFVNTADLTFGGLFPDSYISVFGTSFAAPHVAGGMALLKEAFPAATVTQLEDALTQSAFDLGSLGPDNDYGNGLLDLVAAHDWLVANIGGPQPGDFEFSLGSYSVAENGFSLTVTVNRSGGSAGAVTVDYNTTDNTALDGQDYTAASGTVLFADGEISQTFAVTILNDTLFEGDESFDLTLFNPTGGAEIGLQFMATATITDDDPQAQSGSLEFAVASYNISEAGAVVSLTVNRSGGIDGAVSVDVATVDGSAAETQDYTAANATLNFADGQTSVTFSVTILDDTLVEGDENFNIILSNPTGGAILGALTGTVVTINDDDTAGNPAGSLQFELASYNIPESREEFPVTVTRTGGSTGFVSVTYSTADGSALAGLDYKTMNKTLSLADGEISKTFKLKLLKDSLPEGDESFSVTLSSPSNGAILGSPVTAVITIVDDDGSPSPQPGVLQFNAASYSVAENGLSATVIISRTDGSDGAVTVDYASTDGTATAGADYTANNGTLTFAAGVVSQSFTVNISDDVAVEGDETVNLALSNVTGEASLGTLSTVVLTIVDDDQPPVQSGVLQFNAVSYNIAENGLSATVTISRTGGSDGVVTVDYASSDGTATGGSDYTTSSGTLTFAAGVVTQSFTVNISDDVAVEGDETVNLALSNVTGGASLGTLSAVVLTIVDDDQSLVLPGVLQFSTASYSVNETGVFVMATVSRTGGSDGTVAVDYASTDGTASAGFDYTGAGGTLTFNDGQLSTTFNVAILDDALVEGDESFTLNLFNATGGASLGAQSGATVIITDNDHATGGDLDGDGFTVPADCDDSNPNIHPGALEIKHDDIDQDCNGYDLTINIIRANYKVGDQKIIVKATSTQAGQTGLNVDINLANGSTIIRSMKKKSGNSWELKIEKFFNQYGSQPVSVIVTGVEGSEFAGIQLK